MLKKILIVIGIIIGIIVLLGAIGIPLVCALNGHLLNYLLKIIKYRHKDGDSREMKVLLSLKVSESD
jgi:acid phosphatase family membrane protein YuiD